MIYNVPMKKKLLYLLILFLIFAVGVIIRFVYVSQTSKEGRLQIISSPSANVLINDEPAGKTPYEATLPAGEYNVKLLPDQSGSDDPISWTGTVKVNPSTKTFVSQEIGANSLTSSGVILTVQEIEDKSAKKGTGQIEIQTEPDGGIVFLDDEEQGIAPVILSDIPSGDHELSVFSPGFFRRSQKIQVQPGYRIVAIYSLAIDPAHKKIEPIDEDDVKASDEASLKIDDEDPETTPADTKVRTISINQTDVGYLNVRSKPSTSSEIVAKLEPGDTFEVLEEDNGWLKIEYEERGEGWISETYTTDVK